MVQTRAETMLAWFCERTAPWSERLPMRKEAAKPREARSATFRMARLNCGRAEKEAAYAAGSTECGFPNGAAELRMEKIWNCLRD